MNFESNIRRRHPRNKVGIAEALRACSLLEIRHGRYAQWLAESLGLVWKEPDEVTSVQADTIVAPESTDSDSPAPGSSAKPESEKELKLLEPVGREPIGFEVLFEAQTEKIRGATEIKPASFTGNEERPNLQPLFLERWFQGIFSAILSTTVPSREIDFRKLERGVVQGSFQDVPFKKKSSLIKGVHVLLDRSESMQPFWRDETQLVARLRRLLGVTLVKDSWFEYDSLRSAESGLIWHTPMPRQFHEETPVLLVTDFGSGLDSIAARSMDWEPWLPVLDLARSSRCPVFALMPSSPSFAPTALDRFVDGSLVWDRETSVNTAARICRK